MTRSIEWLEDRVRFIDQTKLPSEECYIETADWHVVADAITRLAVRGAPLIGIAAGYALALAARETRTTDKHAFDAALAQVAHRLRATRPTAVNLPWAIDRLRRVWSAAGDANEARRAVAAEAVRIHDEDARMCLEIGRRGATLVPAAARILTHCNTGALATGGQGTAFSVIVAAHQRDARVTVYADETRPALQGARLTMWELRQAGIPATLITDGMAAGLMRAGTIDLVITGADRIAANGDVANKVGTYGLAVLARHHGLPFIVAAPTSTIDP